MSDRERIIKLKVVFHEWDRDSSDDYHPIEIDSGDPVDLEQTICDYWNDMGIDYYNWSLEKVEEDE